MKRRTHYEWTQTEESAYGMTEKMHKAFPQVAKIGHRGAYGKLVTFY